MVYLHLLITKNFGMKISKLFGILFVGLLLNCAVYADEDHNGCNKDNYSKEMVTNTNI